MKVTLDQLKKLVATYKLRVFRVESYENGYLVQTNKGKKLVSIWENAELLRWSNSWREELFKQGHNQVQRFLTNKNKKKYIRYQGKYFALCDFPDGRTIDLKSEEECRTAGETFAKFHLALDRIDQKVTSGSSANLSEDYFTNGSTAIKQVMQAIEQKANPNLIDEVIYSNLPLIYKRFRRAHQLWEGIQESISYFPLSLNQFHLNQLIHQGKEWFIHGGMNQALSTIHQDTVHLIRDIYQESDWNLQSVTAFLDGYNQQRKLTDHELIYILVQFAIPWKVWAHLEDYLTNDHLNEDRIEQMVEDIRKQRHWDDLAAFLGRFIDEQNNSASA